MPQGLIPQATVRAVNSSALQEPVTLSATGNYVTVGAPGGPVILADPQQPIVPAVVGSALRSVAGANYPSRF